MTLLGTGAPPSKVIPPPSKSMHMNATTKYQQTKVGPPPSDFRTATIDNHWNDPPKKIFDKSTEEENKNLDTQVVNQIFVNQLEFCRTTFQTGPQKRVVDDTTRRIQCLSEALMSNQLSSRVLQSLDELSKALESKQYGEALKVQTHLMKTEYETHGNWILGLKRLIDLSEKATST